MSILKYGVNYTSLILSAEPLTFQSFVFGLHALVVSSSSALTRLSAMEQNYTVQDRRLCRIV
jgi:hypothetical protein